MEFLFQEVRQQNILLPLSVVRELQFVDLSQEMWNTIKGMRLNVFSPECLALGQGLGGISLLMEQRKEGQIQLAQCMLIFSKKDLTEFIIAVW